MSLTSMQSEHKDSLQVRSSVQSSLRGRPRASLEDVPQVHEGRVWSLAKARSGEG